ncbi:lysine N(6)-hydroxylase/L-ornithine N(5)-oxygenase family protein [Modestobacter sp. VKM Ac-2984]|uniref:lysine N(6)-hydroxylase/L-ornithine N(5)-oxygenase family protein n=1 Tax=Modestobacter sp. VKM Ac-2984 TaxID=3004138 RepID=UPI0022AB36D9|nr:SidA/IucD/PvdA family monooxygenase [Modestobacter sp. VKM Ac-2984]MCZ2817548.1 SidA/IucD/PvdA family monooxygenase [Modestobacter sp. VKM Ac-2984]
MSTTPLDAAPVHDFVAIGIGPFNLGLAALTAPVPDLSGVFLDEHEEFSWHPGMMIEGTTLQVPFLADLVTMADPTSPYSFLAHLKATGRLYPFYIREDFHPLRAEYDAYCRWVAERVPGLRWGRRVERVEHDAAAGVYRVLARDVRSGEPEVHLGRRLVLGVGTAPWVPEPVRDLPGPAWHSSRYLEHKEELQTLGHVTVVGSGQSAAEVYLDLLTDADRLGYRVDWLTRSPRFFPMEYTKLTLEMTSPEYARYHHALPMGRRDALAREQRHLYKGISGTLVDAIYDTLYRTGRRGAVPSSLHTGVEVVGARWDAEQRRYELRLHHAEQGRTVTRPTQGLVLATGYRSRVPAFLDPVRDRIRWDARGRYDVALDYAVDVTGEEVFVQNAEEHTHSLTAPDLGMGPYRNSVIVNAMCGREIYPVEQHIAYQEFGVELEDTDALPDEAGLTATGALR